MKSSECTERNGWLVIRYHNIKMLLTLDLNTLIRILLEEFGSTLELRFEEMSEVERVQSTKIVEGLHAVQERFYLFWVDPDGKLQRREDLEQKTVHEGRK